MIFRGKYIGKDIGFMIPLSPSGTPPKLGGELVTDAACAECGLIQNNIIIPQCATKNNL
jgi:hypothetical protein